MDINKSYEEQVKGSEATQICYISIGGKTIGTHTQVLNTDYVQTSEHYAETPYNRYFHTDALGSITAITDDTGTVVERRSYEPFGKIRAMDYGLHGGTIIPINTVTQTTRAFTGHEQIAELSGLIHMNARVYDSNIGRFLSADTILQYPYDSQGYNRYSYIENNPLAAADPSGHGFFSSIGKAFRSVGRAISHYIRPIIAIAVGAVIVAATGGLGVFAGGSLVGILGTGVGGAIATGAVVGAASGAIITGTLRGAATGAIWGAIGAGVAAGIGGILEHAEGILSPELSFGGATIKAGAHGLSRGIISLAQGGTFRAGFASGFGASFLSPGTTLGNDTLGEAGGIVARTTIAATVGGTASVIGGGTFANGAVSGAFVHLFNAEGRTITKAFQSLASGLVGVGDYLGRITGFRDWQVNSIGLGDNYYRNQAIFESNAVYALGVHAIENPGLSTQALSIYYNLNSTQMDANTMVNFYVGLAVPGVGALSLAGNIISEAHEINGIYNNLRNSR